MNIFKKCAIGVAVSSGLAFAGAAQAGTLGTSVMQISNLGFYKGTTATTLLANSDFSLLTFTNTANIATSMGGSGPASNGNGTPLDLAPVCVGACPAIANNTFPAYTAPPFATFGAADQNESGAPISGLKDSKGNPISTLAKVESGSYAQVTTTGNPNSQANNALSSDFQFVLGTSTAVTFNFNALAYLEAFTAATEQFPADAHASYKVCFTVTNSTTGATVVNYCPDGLVDPGTFNSFGIVSEVDPFTLNTQVSRNAPVNGQSLPVGEAPGVKQSGLFTATTIVLAAGVPFHLSAQLNTQADATRVPEPGTLALLGLGLFGLAAAGLRRRNGKG